MKVYTVKQIRELMAEVNTITIEGSSLLQMHVIELTNNNALDLDQVQPAKLARIVLRMSEEHREIIAVITQEEGQFDSSI